MCLLVAGLLPFHPQQRLDFTDSFWIAHTSTQWLHLGWWHLALNLAGLAVVAWGFDAEASLWTDTQVWLGCLLLTPLYITWFEPLPWYCGLSGALHGVFVFKLLKAINRQAHTGPNWPLVGLAMGLFAKLIVEWVVPPTGGGLLEGPTAPEAHRGGVVAGILMFLLIQRLADWRASRR